MTRIDIWEYYFISLGAAALVVLILWIISELRRYIKEESRIKSEQRLRSKKCHLPPLKSSGGSWIYLKVEPWPPINFPKLDGMYPNHYPEHTMD